MRCRRFSQPSTHLTETPPDDGPRQVLAILGILAFFVLAYSLLGVQHVLFGIFVLLAPGLVSLFFAFIRVSERIANSLELLVEQERRE